MAAVRGPPSWILKFSQFLSKIQIIAYLYVDMLVIAFHFNPLNVNRTCFLWLTLQVVYLLIEVRSKKSQDRNDTL